MYKVCILIKTKGTNIDIQEVVLLTETYMTFILYTWNEARVGEVSETGNYYSHNRSFFGYDHSKYVKVHTY